MTTTKRGLGRGLSALIPDSDMEFLTAVARSAIPATPVKNQRKKPASPDKSHSKAQNLTSELASEPSSAQSQNNPVTVENEAGAQYVAVNAISPNPYQPRRMFSDAEMQELVDSISTHGLLQPVLIRPIHNSEGSRQYQLVAGERRWRAAQKAGLSEVPAIIRDVDNQQALELALIENVQRHDISAMDAAVAYQRLASEFGLAQEQIAQRVGKSRSAIANTLRLLDLPNEVQKAIEDGTVSEGHGRAILLARGEGARRAVFRRVLRDKLSVRETERLAQASEEHDTDEKNSPSPRKPKNVELQQVEALLQKKLGVRARIAPKRKGGMILVPYSSNDELQRILDFINQ
jgi:ParB family transcriptional regulator, chromosome partitioning protein